MRSVYACIISCNYILYPLYTLNTINLWYTQTRTHACICICTYMHALMHTLYYNNGKMMIACLQVKNHANRSNNVDQICLASSAKKIVKPRATTIHAF